MTSNMEDNWVTGCFLCLLSVFATLTATQNAGNSDACGRWANIAKRLTGSGRIQLCLNNQTDHCTRFDCEGTLRITHQFLGPIKLKAMSFDYCFGSQLHSCDNPVSMDFYLQLPAKNFTFTQSIEHNKMITLKDLKIPFGGAGTAIPVILFGMEEKTSGFIEFSVVMKVQLEAFGTSIFLPQLQRTLINETAILVETCTKEEKKAEFQTSACHVKKYQGQTTMATTVTPTIKPSSTLHKECDVVSKPCSHGEICDHVQYRAVCVCSPDFRLSRKKNACVSYSHIRQSCSSWNDCGYNEKCEKSDTEGFVCKCSSGYQYSAERELCIVGFHGGDSATAASTHTDDNGKKDSSKTVEKSAKASVNKYIIIGASAGAALLLVVVVVGFVCHRRRRNMIRVDLNDSHHQHLLSRVGDADDMNIIM